MKTEKQAIIFAAGFGTRLKPLTNTIPKALVEINGVPILEIIILKLIKSNFKKIVINTHYFSNQIETFIKNKNFSAKIILSYEKDVLETGGGLVFARKYFSEGNILIYNGDILTDIDINNLWNSHLENKTIATFASFPRKSFREFLWNNEGDLCGWRNTNTGEYKWSKKTEQFYGQPFAAIHVISTDIFEHLPKSGKFSLTPYYIEIAKTKNIKRFNAENSYWVDIGTIEKLKDANTLLKKK